MKQISFPALMALGLTAQVSFAATVFTENFTYADGSLVGAVGSPWQTTSGATPGEVNVVANAAVVSQAETEDVNAPITPAGTFFNSGTLTLTMSATFTTLPAVQNYFAHLKDSTTSGFRGRIFATTTGATAGSFRLGISNSTTTTAIVATDLSLDTPIAITMAWNAAAGTASLSVNGGTAVAAVDAASFLNISSIGLRQSTNIGIMTIDNISVDATALAVPEPSTALLGLLAGLGLMRRRR